MEEFDYDEEDSSGEQFEKSVTVVMGCQSSSLKPPSSGGISNKLQIGRKSSQGYIKRQTPQQCFELPMMTLTITALIEMEVARHKSHSVDGFMPELKSMSFRKRKLSTSKDITVTDPVFAMIDPSGSNDSSRDT
jgi:hypothetical protein